MRETKPTNCHFCGYLCAFLAEVEDGRIVDVRPDPTRYPYDEKVLAGCRRWRHNLDTLDGADRVNYPLRRVGERGSGSFERVGWDEALDDIARRLRVLADEHGPETLASMIGGPHTSFWPLHRFMNLFGSPNNMGIGQICWNPRIWMDVLTFGWTIEADIRTGITDCLIIWGTNPAQSDNSAFWQHLRGIARSNAGLREAGAPAAAEGVAPAGEAASLCSAERPEPCAGEARSGSASSAAAFCPGASPDFAAAAAFDSDAALGSDPLRATDGYVPFIVIDPLFTQTARLADIWVPIRPGTDIAFALGMLNVIVAEDLMDRAFVDEWCHGFDELAEAVAPYPPDRVADICGIPEALVRRVARLWGTAHAGALVSGRGIDQVGRNVAPTHRAICCLRAVRGFVDSPGTMILQEGSDFVSEYELELTAALAPEHKARCLNTPYTPLQCYRGFERVAELTRSHGNELPERYLTSAHPDLVLHAMETGEPYPVRALIVEATNPLLTYADTHRVFAALMSLDLIVVLDYYLTSTAQVADYVLPSAAAMERATFQAHGGVANNAYGGPAAVAPYYERRTDYDIFRALALRLGQAEHWPWESFEDAIAYTLAPTGMGYEDYCTLGAYYQPPRPWKYEEPAPPADAGAAGAVNANAGAGAGACSRICADAECDGSFDVERKDMGDVRSGLSEERIVCGAGAAGAGAGAAADVGAGAEGAGAAAAEDAAASGPHLRGFATTTGKVELASEILAALGGPRVPAMQPQLSLCSPALIARAEAAGGAHLQLITGARKQPYNASMYFNIPDFAPRTTRPVAEVSPATAERLGLAPGDEVVLATDKGEARFVLKTRTMRDDLVSADYGWWDPAAPLGALDFGGIWEGNVNCLTSCDVSTGEAMIGTWSYNAIDCVLVRG